MTRFLKTYIYFVILAGLYRLLADQFLRSHITVAPQVKFADISIGFLSDIWISFLLALPILLINISWPKWQKRNLIVNLAWIFLWAILTAAHLNYVEFFHHSIIPFHLTYLFDASFLSANGPSFYSFKTFLIMALSFIFSVWISFARVGATGNRLKLGLNFLLITFVSISAHAANIRFRINWFVPEKLQTHFLEQLFINLKTKVAPKEITEFDLRLLTEASGISGIVSLRESLCPNYEVSIEAASIRKRLNTVLVGKRVPLVIVIASESFRPADSGWTRSSQDLPSITPNFDALAASGSLFANAYSTGPVTRGGQEALWCGVPSATNTSLMRSFPHFKAACIPDFSTDGQIKSNWIHGGDSRFDNQLEFWKSHNVSSFILKDNFSRDTPETGWGISDLAVFESAARFLKSEAQQESKPLASMILSVTNHIPWNLPKDAPDFISKIESTHPSQLTTAYFDFALGRFVQELKSNGLWQDTLLIISSDHGNLEIPRNASYRADSETKYEHLASHINLLISGGIAEAALYEKEIPQLVKGFYSQAQVAPFISEVLALPKDPTCFEKPLFTKSTWPVAADLNQFLFLPESNSLLPKEELLAGTNFFKDKDSYLASARHRAFLQLLYSQPKKK